MSLTCRLLGHRRSGPVYAETGELRTDCSRCGRHLMKIDRNLWQSVEVGQPKRSLRAALRRFRRSLACRRGRHEPTSELRWVNDESGLGYHLSRCRACGKRIGRAPTGQWRTLREAG